MVARQRKGISVKSYYKRAKAFGYLMVAVAIGYVVYALVTTFFM